MEYESREAAEKARDHLDGGQIDGNTVTVQFVLVPKRREPSPPPRRRCGPLGRHGAGGHGIQAGGVCVVVWLGMIKCCVVWQPG